MTKKPEDSLDGVVNLSGLEQKTYFVARNRKPSVDSSDTPHKPVASKPGAWFTKPTNRSIFKQSARLKRGDTSRVFYPVLENRFYVGHKNCNKYAKLNARKLPRSGLCRLYKESLCIHSHDRRHTIRSSKNYEPIFFSIKGINFLRTNTSIGILKKETQRGTTQPIVEGLGTMRVSTTKLQKLIASYIARVNTKAKTNPVNTLSVGGVSAITAHLFNVYEPRTSTLKFLKTSKHSWVSMVGLEKCRGFSQYREAYKKYSRFKMKSYLSSSVLGIPVNYRPIQQVPRPAVTCRSKRRGAGFWLNNYAFSSIQPLMGFGLTVINFNILSASTRSNYKRILRSALATFPFLQLNRVAAHFVATIYTALILKETKSLTLFIRKTLREVHFKKHPFYFAFVGSLIRDVIQPQLHRFNCLGLSVVFKGKLGIGGNARKRTLKYQTGMISSSSKYVKLSRSIDIVRTKTGVVGFTVILAW